MPVPGADSTTTRRRSSEARAVPTTKAAASVATKSEDQRICMA
jgi:hypothetical protein